jgi:hypothetical protein
MNAPAFNIEFPGFITAFAVSKVRVPVGTKFRVNLDKAQVSSSDWYSNNDPVLEVDVDSSGSFADVTGTSKGQSFIVIGQLRLEVEVIDNPSSQDAVDSVVSSPTFRQRQ